MWYFDDEDLDNDEEEEVEVEGALEVGFYNPIVSCWVERGGKQCHRAVNIR